MGGERTEFPDILSYLREMSQRLDRYLTSVCSCFLRDHFAATMDRVLGPLPFATLVSMSIILHGRKVNTPAVRMPVSRGRREGDDCTPRRCMQPEDRDALNFSRCGITNEARICSDHHAAGSLSRPLFPRC